MIKSALSLHLLFLISFSCDPKPAENAQSDSQHTRHLKEDSTTSALIREALLGVWTDGTGPNATFILSADSIEYTDSEEVSAYAYDLVNDSIVMHYADHDYRAKVITGKDSLIFEGRDGKTVFTRFKE
jgi:hypothetical protein